MNDEAVAAATDEAGCSRAALDRLNLPVFNVHFADPAPVRGLPPVFWEIAGGREVIHVTFHVVTTELDAGPIVIQREIPIAWHPTLAALLAARRVCRRRLAARKKGGSAAILTRGGCL